MKPRLFCRGGSAIALVLLVVSASVAASPTALERGANWLLQQQAADGGWHSTTYGPMQSGVGNTALALDALSRMPLAWRAVHQRAIDRGISFLLGNLAETGYLSSPHHAADFPTYATALLLTTLNRLGSPAWGDERQRMRRYLLAIQREGTADEPRRGGWPQIGGEVEDAAAESNVNLSVTRHVVEALHIDLAAERDQREAALSFVARCQNPNDGGFFFLPVADDPLNKAGQHPDGTARSYGTMTADGILALLACGRSADDAQIARAITWLEHHDTLATVPGLSSDQATIANAEGAITFYYWAALSQVMQRFPNSALRERQAALIEQLVSRQRADGSWANANALMREDDPLIATSLAIIALATLEEIPAQ